MENLKRMLQPKGNLNASEGEIAYPFNFQSIIRAFLAYTIPCGLLVKLNSKLHDEIAIKNVEE